MNRVYKGLFIRYACFPEGIEGKLEVTKNGRKSWCSIHHSSDGDRYIVTHGIRIYIKDCTIL